ncbi:MAG: hypothetical protein JO165_00585, partial [Candidatus Eremiobacteraeota bacterium]|nr:hypothetical protein [Candidatus Eremiobacteraeota bacterium]
MRTRWIATYFFFIAICVFIAQLGADAGNSRGKDVETPVVVPFSATKAEDAARILRSLYPKSHITVDRAANALIITASSADVPTLRQIASQIDTRDPLALQTQAFALHRIRPDDLLARLQPLFRNARFTAVNAKTMIAAATAPDLQQIQTLVAAIDAPAATPAPAPATPSATEAVHILLARPKDVAREVAGAVRGVRAAVAGQSVVLAGAPDAVQRAKDIIAVLDAAPSGTPYTAVYRIKTLDAKSVGDLLQRAFPNAKIVVNPDINSLSVTATAAEQRRIADGIAQLDSAAPPSSGGAVAATSAGGGGPAQIYSLKYALPG